MSFVNVLWSTWVPTDLASLELWLDSGDESTITHSSGSVSQWNDKSGNARNVTQGTAAAQPTTGVLTLNGLNVIDWDGTDDVLVSPADLPDLTAMTVLMVERHDSTGGAGFGRMFAIGNENRRLGIEPTNSRYESYFNDVKVYSNDNTATNSVWRLTTLIHTGGTALSSVTIRVDGVDQTNNGTGTTVTSTLNNALYVGNRLDGARGHDGGIAEFIVCSAALSGTDLSDAESYLADRWGITI